MGDGAAVLLARLPAGTARASRVRSDNEADGERYRTARHAPPRYAAGRRLPGAKLRGSPQGHRSERPRAGSFR